MDDLHAPSWLNQSFIEKVLQKSECDKNLKVSSIGIKPATQPGQHFASVMYRVTADFFSSRSKPNGHKSLIVKTIPILEGRTESIDTTIFDNEIKMYTVTLPEIQRLMELSGDKEQFVPRLVYQAKEPNFVIVLEDITVLGFDVIKTQLDFENTLVVAHRLAKFHAASYYMESDNQHVSDYDIGLFNEIHVDSLGFLLENLVMLTDALKTWPGHGLYVDKFEKIQQTFLNKGCDVYEPNPRDNSDGYNVLNHGDFHFKNMMIKRNGNRIDKLFLIDFQTVFYGSPAIDLIYLLYTVASTETRKSYRLEILRQYFKTFIETLRLVGYIGKLPTLLELNVEMAKKGFLEVILAVCSLPFLFINFEEVAVEKLFDESAEGVAIKKSMFDSPEYQAILKDLLKEFLHRGLLD